MARPRKKPAWIEVAASLFAEKIGMPYEHRRLITSEQVMSLARIDHYPEPHAEDGPDLHYNLTVRTIIDHAEKTATVDVPGIAKRKRVAEKHAEHLARIAAKSGDDPRRAALAAAQIGLESENPDAVGEALLSLSKDRSRSRIKRERPKSQFGARKFNSKGKRSFGR